MLYRQAVTGDDARDGVQTLGLLALAGRWARAGLGLGLGVWMASCGGGSPKVVEAPEQSALMPPACGVDEVREYRCDALLPRTSALPAPEPYETCPSGIEVRDALFPPRSGSGRFDADRTERARRRAPPGTQCCYSWCGKLNVVDPGAVVDRCRDPLAFSESYCTSELEGGTRGALAGEPYPACAAAIRPPPGAAFSVPPKGALLDFSATTARRRSREKLCCYGWCSVAPPGSALERKR